jgi:hypothetical protein
VALVRPAQQEVAYESIAKRPDATWYQQAVGYVGYGSGWLVDEVKPGFFFSTARLNDGSTLIGLPGVQAWYRLCTAPGVSPANRDAHARGRFSGPLCVSFCYQRSARPQRHRRT